jgi:hypothetical protein
VEGEEDAASEATVTGREDGAALCLSSSLSTTPTPRAARSALPFVSLPLSLSFSRVRERGGEKGRLVLMVAEVMAGGAADAE